jgi:hypothetical protein
MADERLETLRHWINLYDRSGEQTIHAYSEAPEKSAAHR